MGDEEGAGKPHDSEKQRLAGIIKRLNDLHGAEISDDNKLLFGRIVQLSV
ncbi:MULTISPECIES: hypothetical protein [unclassified Halomonas]|nr:MULTISPECIES: hypothetical protein [unclassified Halomonas]MCG7590011.1 hypothetical protein [Halomonas sp. McD50-5]MCG7615939.1 hypothetical protein [Halomonas sp. McD50-4]